MVYEQPKPGARSGIAAGLNKGHVVTIRNNPQKAARRKGAASKRVTMIRSVVREVMGLAPYERRMMEQLKLGKAKRCLRFARKRLGTHQRAKRKVQIIDDLIRAESAARQAKKKEEEE